MNEMVDTIATGVTNVIPIGRMEADIDRLLGAYSTAVSTALSAGLGSIAVAGLTLYLLFTGLAISRGEIQEPMSRLTKDFLGMVLISSIALVAGFYQQFVMGAVSAVLEFLISKITDGNATTVGKSLSLIFSTGLVKLPEGEASILTLLFVLAKKNAIVEFFPDLSYLFAAIFVWIATAVICIFCLIPVLLAKVALAIMLAIGPLFIMLAIWPQTRNYFASWLSNLIGNILTLALISAVATLIARAFTAIVVESLSDAASPGFNAIPVALSVLVVAVVLAFVALNVAAQGAQLAGGGLAMDTKGIVGSAIQSYLLYKNGKKKPDASEGGSVTPSTKQRVGQVLSGITNRSKK